MEQERGRVTRRGVPQRLRLGVEHQHDQRDELLTPVDRRHLPVEFLERLRRIAELGEERPQQVLGLKGGDRRLDAMAGDIADDRCQPRRRSLEDVEEVAGHEAGSRLVDASHLEAGELGKVLGGESGGPCLGGQVLLVQRLLGTALDVDCLASHASLTDGVARPDRGDQGRQSDEGKQDRHTGRVEVGADERHHRQQPVEDRRVGLLAEGRPGQRVGVRRRLGVDPVDQPVAVPRRTCPAEGGCQAHEAHEGQYQSAHPRS